jgi:soluble lytic murein transglycosylase-like protein
MRIGMGGLAVMALMGAAVAAYLYTVQNFLNRRLVEAQQERRLLLARLEAARREIDQTRRVVELCRRYGLLARAYVCSDEPSLLVCEAIVKAVDRYGAGLVDDDDVAAVMLTESCFDKQARSPAGALGLMQIMPATASDYGVQDPKRLMEVELNIEVGVRILADLVRRFGDHRVALRAYNRGPARVHLAPVNRYDGRVTDRGGF